ncbi:hypothetical protein [Pseudomonas sp. GCM10023245]|uniref:DUF7834 domain-containing protein n=1 Tax=Pseudomonas sp. GCM10023245 TaxID=3252652 RepID=UPI0036188720
MKSRHWQALRWRNVSSDRDPGMERAEIVTELAERTLPGGPDIAYRPLRIRRDSASNVTQAFEAGYDMRQPLSTGINTIRYIEYFHKLQEVLLENGDKPDVSPFQYFYKRLALDAGGSVFLSRIYDCALLFYVNKFGTSQLLEGSLWLFRMVFSLRLINDVSVRENGAQAFVREHPVLDWIASSFNHSEVMEYLRNYKYSFSAEGLDRNSIKKRFIQSVAETLGLDLPWQDVQRMQIEYDLQLRSAIERLSPTIDVYLRDTR